MSRARRYDGAGVRRGVRSPRGGAVTTVASILGDAYQLHYRSGVGFFTPGTGPDVAAQANLGLYGSGADISEAVASKRPHFDAGPPEEHEYLAIASRELSAISISNIYEPGDLVSIITVPKYVSGQAFVEVGKDNDARSGLQLQVTGGNLLARAFDAPVGFSDATFAFSADGLFRVVRATLDGTDLSLWTDGIERASNAAVSDAEQAGNSVMFGGLLQGAAFGTFDTLETIVAVSATPINDELAELDDFLKFRHGTP